MQLSFEIISTAEQKKEKNIYKEIANSADNVIEKLDKILRKSKMKFTDIKNIKIINLPPLVKSEKVDDSSNISYTSYRIIKSIEKALNFNKKYFSFF